MDFYKIETGLTTDEDNNKILYLINSLEFESWVKTKSSLWKSWLAQSNFKPNSGSFSLLPDQMGNVEAALLIISCQISPKQNNTDSIFDYSGWTSIWQISNAAEKCPDGVWRIMFNKKSFDMEPFYLGWGLAQYRFKIPGHKSITNKKNNKINPKERYNIAKLYAPNSKNISAIIQGICLCRNLINLPANFMNTNKLAKFSSELAEKFSAELTLYSGKELQKYAPAIDVVGRASENPPYLIDFKWGTEGPKITIVGKGITFDTGGLDLKPSKAMEIMKKDMGGAAHALGLASTIMETRLSVQLRVLIPVAENSVSDKSMRPLDIIETAAGIPVEIGNTDAEGRLVLADALFHAKQDAPDFVVDYATLTGAARVALGTECPALFCNKTETARKLMLISEQIDDPLWHMPLFEPYERFLKTETSALSSTGQSGYGGAITAALFLRKFIGKELNWAHIDVMAWNISSRPGRPKGGEAMGLRTVYQYIAELAKNH